MKENKWKKFARYYKPYLGSFAADMFFAILGAAVTLIIPMVVRYITGTVIYEEPDKAMKDIAVLAVVMIALVAVEFVCNYFIATVGHNMGAKAAFPPGGRPAPRQCGSACRVLYCHPLPEYLPQDHLKAL